MELMNLLLIATILATNVNNKGDHSISRDDVVMLVTQQHLFEVC